ncbi:PspC domain-containing protein [Streptomyces sp. NPDC051597]|uniref:PspC domain-containing protein n=1 Tax=Streptomyces sp. NPDC051597 TaxID=3155049 RepID=UPI0034410516
MTPPTETPVAPPDPDPGPAPAAPQLRRSGHNKVIGGVCGGLGRYCDIDPVIFRVALGVLTVTGGLGLLFYGFGWLLLPQDGEEENEARRLLSGRVEGPALAAVLMALAGCGIFLSMLSNGSVMSFAWLLTLAVAGVGVWSQRRSLTPADAPPDAVGAPATPGTVSPAFGPGAAPPETKAPPTPASPSWWRDPIVKDGTTGPVGTGYLWGADDADPAVGLGPAGARAGKTDRAGKAADRATRGPRAIGGFVFLLALLAAGAGTAGAWSHQPLGTALQIGLAAALVVFGLGLVVSAFAGRTGFGTLFMAVLTAALLAGASALPKTITTEWTRTDWAPAAAADVQPSYALGSGEGTLDLSRVVVPSGQSVRTRAEVGAGRLKVLVPLGATVKAHIVVGIGDVQLPTEKPEDVDIQPNQKKTVTLAPPAGAKPAGTLELDLHVSIGQAEVDRAAS